MTLTVLHELFHDLTSKCTRPSGWVVR